MSTSISTSSIIISRSNSNSSSSSSSSSSSKSSIDTIIVIQFIIMTTSAAARECGAPAPPRRRAYKRAYNIQQLSIHTQNIQPTYTYTTNKQIYVLTYKYKPKRLGSRRRPGDVAYYQYC